MHTKQKKHKNDNGLDSHQEFMNKITTTHKIAFSILCALIRKTEEKIFAYISLEPPCKRNKQKRKEKIAFLSVIHISETQT